VAALLLLSVMLSGAQQVAWVPEVWSSPDPLGEAMLSRGSDQVIPLPESVDPRLRRWFNRYTRCVAPNGKPLHILAQEGWRDEQILRVRKVLEHMLTDVPGTRYGSDKAPIANAMADRRATLVLFNTARDLERAFRRGLGEVELGFQDLRANECPVEGDPDYLRHETRDAAFEEILHLVHDYGIRPVHPEYDEALHRANLAAAERGLWHAWPEDEPENHRNEYFAAVYDNFLDLWAVKPLRYEGEVLGEADLPDGTSHFGNYGANSRSALAEADPRGLELIAQFFGPSLLYTAELPADFAGTFSLRVDPKLRYTLKSQHLVNVTLSGTHDSGLAGNDQDNQLTGNSGNNTLAGEEGDDTLRGGGGDDHLFGGTGTDVALYSANASQYRIVRLEEDVVVTDKRVDGDGTDVLRDVESVRFTDGEVLLPQQ